MLGFHSACSTCRLLQRKKNTGCGSRRETIEDISSLAAFGQDSRSAQDHLVLRDVGLTPAKQRLQVADARLAIPQRAGNLQPDGVGERLEHAGLGGTFRIRSNIQFLEYDGMPCAGEQGEMSCGRRTVRGLGGPACPGEARASDRQASPRFGSINCTLEGCQGQPKARGSRHGLGVKQSGELHWRR